MVVYVTACKSINGESEERKADVCLRCTGGLETRKRRGGDSRERPREFKRVTEEDAMFRGVRHTRQPG